MRYSEEEREMDDSSYQKTFALFAVFTLRPLLEASLQVAPSYLRILCARQWICHDGHILEKCGV